MKGFGQKPRVMSRCSNKENRQQQPEGATGKSPHFQIHMAVKPATKDTRVVSPSNSQHPQHHTANNSLDKPAKESLNFGQGSRQSIAQVLSKSTSKLGSVRPRIDFQPSTTKSSHSKSFLRSKEAFQPQNRVTIKGALSRTLFEVSKYSYEGLQDGIDHCLQELEQQVDTGERETVGLVRILLEKVFEKQTEYHRQKVDALDEAEELARLYRQELKRKGRELLWLKQQISCLSESQWKQPKSPEGQPLEDQLQCLSETDESSICSYIVPPSEPHPSTSTKFISDEMRNKLRLNMRKVRESHEQQNPSD